MEGDLENESLKGVIPRAAEAIFEHRDRYTDFHCTAQYLEIFNEELSDLLLETAPMITPRGGFGNDAKGDATPRLELREEPPKKKGERGRVSVNNLSTHKVENPEDILKLIQRAQSRRHVGETKMNKHSSRSHCVFTLTVKSTRRTSDGGSMECTGKLHLVDLAGSECAKTAGGVTDGAKAGTGADARERERKNINQSLLTLGRVISTLRNANGGDVARIPYRDSKLTRLLQESLGGRSKTVIIATLSPSVMAVEETFSTLSYAQQAAGIQNKPIAVSYLKVGAPKGATDFVGKEGGAGGDGTTLQDWHHMECKLFNLQTQMEEAQSLLARKHLEQEAIIKRAETAEAEREDAKRSLADKVADCERMAAENEQQRQELAIHAFLLTSRASVEAKLSKQAKDVLGCLEMTESEAADLHITLSDAAAAHDAQTARRHAFNSSLLQTLATAEAQVSTLASALEKQRGASLALEAKAQATLGEHTATLGKHAASIASVASTELGRAAGAFAEVRTDAGAVLDGACAALASGTTSAAADAVAAQADVDAQLRSAVDAIKAAQVALTTSVDTTVGRQAATELEATAKRGEIGEQVKAAAMEVAERLRTERARLSEHTASLRSLLSEVRSAKATELEAREALVSLKAQAHANDSEAAERLRAVAKAIDAASAAQLAAQQDAPLLSAIDAAGTELQTSGTSTSKTLDAQRGTLSAALGSQHEGNAAAATAAALGKTRKAVDDAAAARVAEAHDAAAKLSHQQSGLQQLLAEQQGLCDAMRSDIMASVEAKLQEHLTLLAKQAASGIELAVNRSTEVVELTSTSAAAIQTSTSE